VSLCLALFTFTNCSNKTETPLFVIDNTELKQGFIDSIGKIIIPCHFAYVRWFSNGLAIASLDGLTYGFINQKGEFVIQPKFKLNFSPLSLYPLKVLKLNDSTKELRSLISEYSFADNRALYYDIEKNRFGYINTKGDVVIQPTYLVATRFKQNHSVAVISLDTTNWENTRMGIIDINGTMVVPDKYYRLSRLSDNYASGTFVTKKDSSYQFSSVILSSQGRVISSILPGMIVLTGEFSKGYSSGIETLSQSLNRKGYFVYDSTGKTLNDSNGNPLFWEDIVIDNGRFIWYKQSDYYHWFVLDNDKRGRVVDSKVYTAIAAGFNKDGIAAVKFRDQYGFIDTLGNFVLEPKYAYAGNFNHGLAEAGLRNGSLLIRGYINKKGEFVWSREVRDR